MESTITYTFCECGENHVSMQQIGGKAEAGDGFNLFDLQKAAIWCKKNDVEYELWDLRPEGFLSEDGPSLPPAYLLIMRGCANKIVGTAESGELYRESYNLDWDKRILNQYGKVTARHTHHNLVVADFAQEPSYEEGKGRIIPFEQLPLLNKIRETLPDILGERARNMIGEGNHYYEPGLTGIGWHGDTERRRVVGLRLGEKMELSYRWYHRWNIISDTMEFELESGDIYVMSEWAVGTDWHKSTLYTLRHCAGRDRSKKGAKYE